MLSGPISRHYFRTACHPTTENPLCFANRTSSPRLWPRLYGQFVVDGDNPDRKRCSLIVPDGWKRALGVFGAEQGLVVGKVNHDMWMPMARRPKYLVRRPHVGKTHVGALWDLAFDVSCLYPIGNLLGCIAFQPQFCPKFVIRQYGSRGLWVETNGSSGFRVVINVIPDLHRSERRSSGKPAHDHAHKSVVPLVHGLKSGRREYLYRRAVGNVVRSRALGQRNFNVSRHQVLVERRVLGTLRYQGSNVQSSKQNDQDHWELLHFQDLLIKNQIAFTSAITPVDEQDTRSGLAHRGFAGDELRLWLSLSEAPG